MRLTTASCAVFLGACTSTPTSLQVVDALQKRTSSIDHATLNGISTDPSQLPAPNVSGTAAATTA